VQKRQHRADCALSRWQGMNRVNGVQASTTGVLSGFAMIDIRLVLAEICV